MIGIDEVGRGAWAGPLLVVAARVKGGYILPTTLNDSKLLTKAQRNSMFLELQKACDYGEGWVAASVIDELGLSAALQNACMMALHQLGASQNDTILIDGTVNLLTDSKYRAVQTQRKADQTVPVVSAASVIAKVLRDQHMVEQSHMFPGYGFESNVGYGTKHHVQGLNDLGVTLIHRKSFKPIEKIL